MLSPIVRSILNSGLFLQVRFAKEPTKIVPSTEPNDQNKLFFARAPISASEADIKAVFEEFGEVTDVSIFLNRPANTSKGCGFVAYKTREEAEAGIENLHDKKTMTVSVSSFTCSCKYEKSSEKILSPGIICSTKVN